MGAFDSLSDDDPRVINHEMRDKMRIKGDALIQDLKEENSRLRLELEALKPKPEHSELGLLIIQGLKEAVEHFEGKQTECKVTTIGGGE